MIVRSIFDRTLKVLYRAVVVAFPAGLVIWILANIKIYDVTLITYIVNFLDPLGKALGMDGVILGGFILGLPANEIVIPIIVMTYSAKGGLVDAGINELSTLFVANGWTWVTAVSTILFSLIHWPCATTLLTIRKETNSRFWTFLSFIIPTLLAMGICFLFNLVVNLFI